MKVTLWNTYKSYIEIINLEYGNLSNTVVQENRDKWDSSSEFAEAVSNDGIMSPTEKRQAKREFDTLKLDYDSAKAQADYYWPTGLTQPPEKEHAVTVYEDLYTYLFVTPDSKGKALLAPDNMDNNSDIVKTTYDDTFLNFYEGYTNLVKIISNKAKDLADEAQRRVDEVEDNVVYDVKMYSTKGTIFKNGNIDTKVYAKIFHGAEDITDQVDASRWRWIRVSPDAVSDEQWNSTHGFGVKELILSSADVKVRAMFECSVNLDGLEV